MRFFTLNMLAAEAVALAESLSIKDLDLNLRFEFLRKDVVGNARFGNDPTSEHGKQMLEHTDFIIPLLEHAIKARNGDIESQQWLDSLKH